MKSLEVLIERIRERLGVVGKSANEASREAGLGLSYVNDILSGKSKNPVPSRLGQLATVLQCELDYLLGNIDVPRRPDFRQPIESETRPSGMRLYSTNLADADGRFAMHDGETASIAPFSAIEADPSAYAVSVADSGNAPRYEPGQIVIVSPRKPIAPGSFAVIRMADNRGMIRRVLAISGDHVEVNTIANETAERLARAEIKDIHRIIAVVDG